MQKSAWLAFESKSRAWIMPIYLLVDIMLSEQTDFLSTYFPKRFNIEHFGRYGDTSHRFVHEYRLCVDHTWHMCHELHRLSIMGTSITCNFMW